MADFREARNKLEEIKLNLENRINLSQEEMDTLIDIGLMVKSKDEEKIISFYSALFRDWNKNEAEVKSDVEVKNGGGLWGSSEKKAIFKV